jgi:hypothetical protein
MVIKRSAELLQEIKLYQSQDYEIGEESTDYLIMKKNGATVGVHILIFIFFWWTLGIANLIYQLTAVKKKKLMK